jgi:RHS repeat-associated protein
VTDQSGQTTTYSYNDTAVPEDVGRLVSAHVETSGHALVDDWHYSYDAAGNRTKLVHQNSAGTTTTTMAYNAANELCWKYSGTSSNSCASAPSGATSYSFDNRGNQMAAGSTSYGYDNYDRATSLAGTTASYLTPDNTELVAYGTTAYQNNLLGLSRDIGPTTTTNYVRAPSGLPSSQRTSSSKQFFLNDAQGSTIALTDTTGSIVRSYTYDPDGNATSTGSGATTNLQYDGGHMVGALNHFAARYYDPGIARWTQQDPINQMSDLVQANRYAYAGGDPVNNADSSGMCIIFSCKSYNRTKNLVLGGAEVVGGLATAGGSVIGQAACSLATDGVGALHCLVVTYPAFALGAGGVVDGVARRRYALRQRR